MHKHVNYGTEAMEAAMKETQSDGSFRAVPNRLCLQQRVQEFLFSVAAYFGYRLS
jgi:hypothetical protein